jgi:hypothetical protein
MLWQAVGGYDDARRHGEAILALATRTGRAREIVVAHNNLTWHDVRIGELAAAARRLETVLRLAGDVHDTRLQALAVANLAEVARLDGRYADAVVGGRRAIAQLEELGDPGHRRRVFAAVGLALAQAGRVAEAEAVLADVTDEGMVALIEAYLARAVGNRKRAADQFLVAAEALHGQHDMRDVVEALVGAAASTDDRGRRAELLDELDEVCRRSRIRLLPNERAALGR